MDNKSASLRKSGLSQYQRRLQGLFPENNPIDDKDIYAIYNYMYGLSSEINFYNSTNKIDGDWGDFFIATVNLVAFLNSTDKYAANVVRFENLELGIQLAEKDQDIIHAVKLLFNFLEEVTQNVQKVHYQFEVNQPLSGPIEGLAEQIADIIPLFTRLKAIYVAYQQTFGKEFKSRSDFSNVATSDEPDDTFYFADNATTTREKINTSLPELKDVLDQIRIRFSGFLGAVQLYFKNYNIISEDNPPHAALLIAFIHLYLHLQHDLNHITKKHLDFFYGKVLGLKPLDAELDCVDLFLESDPQTVFSQIANGQTLKAALPGGKSVSYAVVNDTVITNARVAAISMLYIARESWYGNLFYELNPYQLSVTLPEQGAFLKSQVIPPAKPIFGEDQNKISYNEKSMARTLIQTIVASPVLFLEEGERTIELSFFLTASSVAQLDDFINNYLTGKNSKAGKQHFSLDQACYELFNEAFVIEYTADDGWQTIIKSRFSYQKVTVSGHAGAIIFKMELTAGQPAIHEFNDKVHGSLAGVGFPALRITMNNYAFINPFSFLNTVSVDRVRVTANVTGASKFRFQNNTGLLSAQYAFQAFGPQPSPGSFLEIQNTNVFNRYLKSLNITINWMGLPPGAGGFEEYYRDYHLQLNNDSFKVKLASTRGSQVSPEPGRQQEISLFDTVHNAEGREFLSSATVIDDIDITGLEFSDKPLLSADKTDIGNTMKQQGFRMELTSPPNGFGAKVYPQLITDVAVHNNRRFVSKKPLPNEPYIPMIRDFQVDYELEHEESIANANDKNNDQVIKIFHLYPFGWNQAYPAEHTGLLNVFPVIDVSRNLYLGIKDAVPGQLLNLYFYIADNTEIDKADHDIKINWSYLSDNSWIPLDNSSILSDTTGKLINSGTIIVLMPAQTLTGNTVMASDLTWLRISIDGYEELQTSLLSVYTNSVKATRLADVTDEGQINTIPPFVIKSFDTKMPGVKEVIQPFSSVNGRQREQTEEFYVRVSERLRYKARPETTLDIEQFILQRFPQLLMAKCISRTENELDARAGTYTVKIVVIPDPERLTAEARKRPKASMALLYEIRRLLKDKLSPFINLELANPVYEEVKLKFDVNFSITESTDYQLSLSRLYNDIALFFCPWLAGAVTGIHIGSKIYVNDLLSYLRSLTYVKSINKFSTVHFYNTPDGMGGETVYKIDNLSASNEVFMQGSIPSAILVPSDLHLITVSNLKNAARAETIGIGDLAIGAEFLVTDNERADLSVKDYEFRSTPGKFNLTINL